VGKFHVCKNATSFSLFCLFFPRKQFQAALDNICEEIDPWDLSWIVGEEAKKIRDIIGRSGKLEISILRHMFVTFSCALFVGESNGDVV
jgi:hypothetical protein